MSPHRWIAVGALLAAVGVLLGAFGAHVLDGQLESIGYEGDDLARRLANHETAVRYQMFHAIGIVLVGLALIHRPSSWWQAAGWAFVGGFVIFSGLLYVLVLAGPSWRWLGAVIPFGGVAMITGWVLLAIGALRS